MNKPQPEISPEKWKKVELLLDQALDLPVNQRTAFLHEASKEDVTLKTLLMGLWEAGKDVDEFLEGHIPGDVVQAIEQLTIDEAYGPAPLKGMRIDEYEIVEEIGRGGMSVVYKARRADGEFDQTVAMKILKRGMDTDQIVQRFLTERQILAGLQHANIARLLDGGTTPDGRPFLIMEYVEGIPITRYCDQARLKIPARLDLFKKVAKAVEFAHHNLIVHRDLKPSNILVMEDGDVRLLDFGIAKVLSPQDDEHLVTLAGGRVMTPEYAAPEQVFGESITTATDVYAMGVLLNELLCGERPLQFTTRSLPAIERAIKAYKAPLPSALFSASDDAGHIAEARDTTPSRLTQMLVGDLDMIVQKALRKEPARRYQSASELIDELERFQTGMPIKARPDSFSYRAQKFYERYRTGVHATSTAFLILIASLIGTLWQAQIASTERDIAQREAAKSERVTEFLVNVFESTDPDVAAGDTLTAYDILERSGLRVENELAEEPELQAEMMTIIGRMYHKMGAFDKAENWLRDAFDRSTKLFDSGSMELMWGSYNLAGVMNSQWHYEEAESLLVALIEKTNSRENLDITHLNLLARDRMASTMIGKGEYEQAMSFLLEGLDIANVVGSSNANFDFQIKAGLYSRLGRTSGYLSEFEDAEKYFEEAIALYKAYPEGSTDDLAEALYAYAVVFRDQGKFGEAESTAKDLLAIQTRILGKEHPRVFHSMNLLGGILASMGNNDAAEQVHLEALELQEKTLGSLHPNTLNLLNGLGTNYVNMGDYQKATYYLRRAEKMQTEILGEDHPSIAVGLVNLAVAEEGTGNLVRAEDLARNAVTVAGEQFGENHYAVGICMASHARVLYNLNRLDDAWESIQAAEDILRENLEPNHRFLAETITTKGLILLHRGRLDDAQSYLEKAVEIYEQSDIPKNHLMSTRPRSALGKLYLAQGSLDKAQSLLSDVYEIRIKSKINPEDWRMGEIEAALGILHLQKQNRQQATTLLKSAHNRLSTSLGDNHRFTAEARRHLARVTP